MSLKETIRILLACIGLSTILISCSEKDDYYWTDAILRRDFEITTDKIEHTTAEGNPIAFDTIDIHREIYDKKNTRFYKIKDIEFVDGSIEIRAEQDYEQATIELIDPPMKVILGPGRKGETRFENIEITHLQKQLVENVRKKSSSIYSFSFASDEGLSFLNVRVYMNIKAFVAD